MKFSLRQLEVLVAIGRGESVSRAAEALSLSQSATSTALAELEKSIGSKLFDRVGKRLQLNERGRLVLPRAVELLERAQALEGLLAGDSEIGPLRIGATLTIGNYLAALLVGEFMLRHPGCHVHLEVANTAAITSKVVHYQLDLGLIEGDCNHPDLQVTPWVADELVIFTAPDHPLARRRQVTTDDLAAARWVLREPGSGTRQGFDHAMRHLQPRLNIQFELDHTEAIKRVVESGLGVGCISRLALKDAFGRGSLVPIEVPGLDLRRHFYFVIHKQKFLTPGILRFLDLCRAVSADVEVSDQIVLPRLLPQDAAALSER